MPANSDSISLSVGKVGSNPVFDNIVNAVGEERAAQLFEHFTTDTRERVERIEHATAAGDSAALQKEAHDLRGTAGHFGFQDLCDLAGEIETACRGGDAQRAHDLARRVQQAAAPVLETATAYGLSESEGDGRVPRDAGT